MPELTDDQKLKEVNKIIKKFQKKNDGADVGIGDENFGRIELLESGVFSFDRLVKGIPRGMFTQITGKSGVGKSTFALNLIANLQKQGLVCALANNERRYSDKWARANGVDTNKLIGGNFEDLEQCLDFMINIASSEERLVDCFIVDTITALSSRGEMADKSGERSTDDNTMALIPRKLSQFFRMSTAKIHKSGIAVILINQIRTNLGQYGAPTKATGGNALDHMKTLDIYLSQTAKSEWPKLEDGKTCKGHMVVATLNKATHTMDAHEGDKMYIPFLTGQGFNNAYDICYHAREMGIFSKSGAQGTYVYVDNAGEEHKVQAKAAIIDEKLSEYFTEKGLIPEIADRFNTHSVETISLETEETTDESAVESD